MRRTTAKIKEKKINVNKLNVWNIIYVYKESAWCLFIWSNMVEYTDSIYPQQKLRMYGDGKISSEQ